MGGHQIVRDSRGRYQDVVQDVACSFQEVPWEGKEEPQEVGQDRGLRGCCLRGEQLECGIGWATGEEGTTTKAGRRSSNGPRGSESDTAPSREGVSPRWWQRAPGRRRGPEGKLLRSPGQLLGEEKAGAVQGQHWSGPGKGRGHQSPCFPVTAKV